MLSREEIARKDCWLWARTITNHGYGLHFYTIDGKSKRISAHRLMYEQLVGAIPEGLVLDHLCRVRRCVNPEHLEPVTNVENIARGLVSRNSRPYCKRGHKFTKENSQWRSSGNRFCRQCNRDRLKIQRQVTKETKGDFVRKVWREKETEHFVRQILNGKTYAELAEEFGIERWQVYGKISNLRKKGLNIPYAPENKRKIDYEKLKKIVGN